MVLDSVTTTDQHSACSILRRESFERMVLQVQQTFRNIITFRESHAQLGVTSPGLMCDRHREVHRLTQNAFNNIRFECIEIHIEDCQLVESLVEADTYRLAKNHAGKCHAKSLK